MYSAIKAVPTTAGAAQKRRPARRRLASFRQLGRTGLQELCSSQQRAKMARAFKAGGRAWRPNKKPSHARVQPVGPAKSRKAKLETASTRRKPANRAFEPLISWMR